MYLRNLSISVAFYSKFAIKWFFLKKNQTCQANKLVQLASKGKNERLEWRIFLPYINMCGKNDRAFFPLITVKQPVCDRDVSQGFFLLPLSQIFE